MRSAIGRLLTTRTANASVPLQAGRLTRLRRSAKHPDALDGRVAPDVVDRDDLDPVPALPHRAAGAVATRPGDAPPVRRQVLVPPERAHGAAGAVEDPHTHVS